MIIGLFVCGSSISLESRINVYSLRIRFRVHFGSQITNCIFQVRIIIFIEHKLAINRGQCASRKGHEVQKEVHQVNMSI